MFNRLRTLFNKGRSESIWAKDLSPASNISHAQAKKILDYQMNNYNSDSWQHYYSQVDWKPHDYRWGREKLDVPKEKPCPSSGGAHRGPTQANGRKTVCVNCGALFFARRKFSYAENFDVDHISSEINGPQPTTVYLDEINEYWNGR